jgi:hypothetical protein
MDPLIEHDPLADLFGDTNKVVTKFVETETKPKRYIFSRIGNSNDLLLRIDNSSLEKFITCPRSAQYKLIENRESPGSPAMAFGSRIHECLELTYKEGFTQESFDKCMKLIEIRYKDEPFPEDEWRSQSQAEKVIQLYYNRYQLDFDTFEPLFVEKAFSLPLFTLPVYTSLPISAEKLLGETGETTNVYVERIHVYWSGKIDLGVNVRMGNLKTVWDHKTSSVTGPQFFEGFQIGQQTVGYVWATQKLLALPTPPSFVLNAIGVRKPTRTGTNIEFARMPYVYSDFHLAEWEQDMMYLVSDFIAHLKQAYFPKATAWCMGKYGKCEYHGVCTQESPTTRKTELFSSTFHDVSWTPFEKPKNIEGITNHETTEQLLALCAGPVEGPSPTSSREDRREVQSRPHRTGPCRGSGSADRHHQKTYSVRQVFGRAAYGRGRFGCGRTR